MCVEHFQILPHNNFNFKKFGHLIWRISIFGDSSSRTILLFWVDLNQDDNPFLSWSWYGKLKGFLKQLPTSTLLLMVEVLHKHSFSDAIHILAKEELKCRQKYWIFSVLANGTPLKCSTIYDSSTTPTSSSTSGHLNWHHNSSEILHCGIQIALKMSSRLILSFGTKMNRPNFFRFATSDILPFG